MPPLLYLSHWAWIPLTILAAAVWCEVIVVEHCSSMVTKVIVGAFVQELDWGHCWITLLQQWPLIAFLRLLLPWLPCQSTSPMTWHEGHLCSCILQRVYLSILFLKRMGWVMWLWINLYQLFYFWSITCFFTTVWGFLVHNCDDLTYCSYGSWDHEKRGI